MKLLRKLMVPLVGLAALATLAVSGAGCALNQYGVALNSTKCPQGYEQQLVNRIWYEYNSCFTPNCAGVYMHNVKEWRCVPKK